MSAENIDPKFGVAMDPTKILIADQNILVRRAFSNALKKVDHFEICWIADKISNIEKAIQNYNPDVLLLNIDSTDAAGYTILSTVRIRFPELPIIAITPRNDEGAEAAINALRLGAVDFVTKPEHKNLILFAERHLEKRLVPLVKAAKREHDQKDLTEEILESIAQPQQTFEEISGIPKASLPAEIVVVGGCTGAIQPLFTLVEALPANLRVPVVIVQHLPRFYTDYLASKLDAVSAVTVREAQNGVELKGGDVWIAPGGYQCEISYSGYNKILQTHRGLRENNMRPSIDILFRSAARSFEERTLGILLSGCGYDGIAGAEEIKKHGGQILVQDPRTAVASELPLSVIRKGYTREYYEPKELTRQIDLRVARTTKSDTVNSEGDDAIIGNSYMF